MFVGNYDGLQKGYKICQLSKKIALKSIPFSTISGDIKDLKHIKPCVAMQLSKSLKITRKGFSPFRFD